jgi:hypothetical protein
VKKSFNREEDNKHWARGYIELAINYRELVSNAQHYFKLFFDFNQHLASARFDLPVQYHWELESAVFTDIKAAEFQHGPQAADAHPGLYPVPIGITQMPSRGDAGRVQSWSVGKTDAPHIGDAN